MSELISGLSYGQKIGAGHFGEVFLGEDPVRGAVAVKRLKKAPFENATQWEAKRAGLLKEGKRLKEAAHRNVVQVHHLLEDRDNDAVLLVMDHCAGGSLQKSYEVGPLPLAVVRKLTTEVTQGLQALHARGMLHRDIKPSNILLTESGTAQLGDFGLVTDELIYGYGSHAGYSDHMAPELALGHGTSTRSDIWALGVTIYRLLHGATWYSESPPPRKLVYQGGFANRLQWLPHIPQRWRRFVRRMLHDEPASRFQSATEVFSALSDLPIQPDWACSVSAAEVAWSRSANLRNCRVEWLRRPGDRHEWKAWSEPNGPGRTRALAGSNGPMHRKKLEHDLVAFFRRQH